MTATPTSSVAPFVTPEIPSATQVTSQIQTQQTTEVMRLSAFSDTSLKSNGAGSLALAFLFGLFIVSTAMTLKARK
jgi:hypothetical protein